MTFNGNGKIENAASQNGNVVSTLAAASSFQFLKPIKFQKTDYSWSYGALHQSKVAFSAAHSQVKIGAFLKRNKTLVRIKDDETYKRVTVRLYGNGAKIRDEVSGKDIGTKTQFSVKKGQFLLSRIDARNGAFAVATDEIDGAIVTNDFPVYDIDEKIINPKFFALLIATKHFSAYFQGLSSGTTNRQRVGEADFLNLQIPLPKMKAQEKLVADYEARILHAEHCKTKAENLEGEIETYLFKELGIEIQQTEKEDWRGFKFLQSANLNSLEKWGYDKILNLDSFICKKYDLIFLEDNRQLLFDVFRGKSPKYNQLSNDKILNQKCVRKNKIVLDYAKSIQSNWKDSIDSKFFTKENDVLVNSTGEGTIGRCAVVSQSSKNFLTDSHILSLRLNEKLINPYYFAIVFNSSFGQEQINSIKSAESTKQTELGINNLLRIRFPLPRPKAQDKIVKHINSLKAEIKSLKLEEENLRRRAKENFETALFEM